MSSRFDVLPNPLQRRTVLVTGAASGIGRSIALDLASRGCRLTLTDTDANKGGDLMKEIQQAYDGEVEASFHQLDVRDEEGVKALVRQAKQTHGSLDALINNAGVNVPMPNVGDISTDQYDLTVNVNLKGVFFFAREFARVCVEAQEKGEIMPEGGWSLVNLGSMASLTGVPQNSVYVATKHAVLGFTRTMAKEYATLPIRVNVVGPGTIDTPMMATVAPMGSEFRKLVTGLVPVGRLGTPEEVAKAVAWLAGPESSYTTGSILMVDGGVTA